jgi:hypothetical protein
VRCYFDERNKIFYLHNGILIQNNKLCCAYGKIDLDQISSMAELVEQINALEIKFDKHGCIKPGITGFRPSWSNNETNKILAKHPLFKDVIVVHGHDGSIDTGLSNIIGVNARDDSNRFQNSAGGYNLSDAPVGICIKR